MKRVLLWSSPRSLLQCTMQFTLVCVILALFIMKSFTLDSSKGEADIKRPDTFHRALQFTQEDINKEKPSSSSSFSSSSHTNSSFLLPKIADWDHQRRAWFARHSNSTPPLRPRILLVTGSSPHKCENPHGDHSLLKFIKNKIDYCRLHDIDIFYNMAHFDANMGDCWSKLPLLRKLMLAHPEVEWLWWMDSDAMFTDMKFEVPIGRYKEYNLVIHGWKKEVYGKRSWTGLNAGVFLIRNCQWTLDLMEEWGPMGGGIREERERLGHFFTKYLTNRPYFEGDDQAALIYLLNSQKERWSSRVHLEDAYFLHGFWEMIVDRYEEIMQSSAPPGLYGDHRWPFVTHFVGCKPCGPASNERCLKHMERAFNFADNQVLQRYGFHHHHLATSTIAPL